MKKRILSALLAAAMALSVLPMGALARYQIDENGNAGEINISQTDDQKSAAIGEVTIKVSAKANHGNGTDVNAFIMTEKNWETHGRDDAGRLQQMPEDISMIEENQGTSGRTEFYAYWKQVNTLDKGDAKGVTSVITLPDGQYRAFVYSKTTGTTQVTMKTIVMDEGLLQETASTATITSALENSTNGTPTVAYTKSGVDVFAASDLPTKVTGTATAGGSMGAVNGVKVAVSKTDAAGTTTWWNGTAFVEKQAWNSATDTGSAYDTWEYTLPVIKDDGSTDAKYAVYAYATEENAAGKPDSADTAEAEFIIDATAPTIVSPANNATVGGVKDSADSTIVLTLSEALRGAGSTVGSNGTELLAGAYTFTKDAHFTLTDGSATDASTAIHSWTYTQATANSPATITLAIDHTAVNEANGEYTLTIKSGALTDLAGNQLAKNHVVKFTPMDKVDISAALSKWAMGDGKNITNSTGAYGYEKSGNFDAKGVYDADTFEMNAPANTYTTSVLAEETALQAAINSVAGTTGTTYAFIPHADNVTVSYWKNSGTPESLIKGDSVTDPKNAGEYIMELSVKDKSASAPTDISAYVTGTVLVPFTITPMPVVLDGTFVKTFDGTKDFVLADLKDGEGAAEATVSAKSGYTLPANTVVTVTTVTAAEAVDKDGAAQTGASTTAYGVKLTGYTLSASVSDAPAAGTKNYYLDNAANETDATKAITIPGKAKITPYVIDSAKLAKYITAIEKAYDATTDLPSFATAATGYTLDNTTYNAGVFELDLATGETSADLGSVRINGLTGAIGTTGNVTVAPEAVNLSAVSLVDAATHANNVNFLLVGADAKNAPSATNLMTLGDIGTIIKNATPHELKAKNVSVNTDAVAVLVMGSFVSSTPALTAPESTDKMFPDAISLTSGVMAAEGMKITFYKDAARMQVYDQTSLPTSASQTLYFSIAVDDTPSTNTNYSALTFSSTAGELEGTLTITKKETSGGGGGGGTSSYTVKFDAGKNGKITKGSASTSVSSGSKVASSKVPTVEANDGYKFLGWSLDGKTTVDPTEQKITKSVTFTALYEGTETPELNKDEHMAYIEGYTDGSFKPGNDITRAEVAAIFARIVKNEIGTDGTTSFSDVKTDAWYAPSIAAMQKFGMLKGYPDGTFRPDAPITREEFTAMATRMGEVAKAGSLPFADVKADSWSVDNIYTAYTAGWIAGYEDGTFRPSANLTRAEAVKMVNAMLERSITAASIEGKQYKTFADVPTTHWAYFDVIEAANAHSFTKDTGKELWK